jgi:hypothetical protein
VDETVRSRLARVADHLIPAGEDRPAANEVGVTGALLDRVLTTVPSLAGVLVATLATEIDDDPAAWLDRLAAEDRVAFTALTVAVGGAYYLDPAVRSGLGYDGQIPRPVRAAEYPDYVAEGLLEPVLANWGAGPAQSFDATSSW